MKKRKQKRPKEPSKEIVSLMEKVKGQLENLKKPVQPEFIRSKEPDWNPTVEEYWLMDKEITVMQMGGQFVGRVLKGLEGVYSMMTPEEVAMKKVFWISVIVAFCSGMGVGYNIRKMAADRWYQEHRNVDAIYRYYHEHTPIDQTSCNQAGMEWLEWKDYSLRSFPLEVGGCHKWLDIHAFCKDGTESVWAHTGKDSLEAKWTAECEKPWLNGGKCGRRDERPDCMRAGHCTAGLRTHDCL